MTGGSLSLPESALPDSIVVEQEVARTLKLPGGYDLGYRVLLTQAMTMTQMIFFPLVRRFRRYIDFSCTVVRGRPRHYIGTYDNAWCNAECCDFA